MRHKQRQPHGLHIVRCNKPDPEGRFTCILLAKHSGPCVANPGSQTELESRSKDERDIEALYRQIVELRMAAVRNRAERQSIAARSATLRERWQALRGASEST